MPMYEFRCSNCHHQFERLCKIDATEGVVCPQCQSVDTKRLVSAPRFRLEGTGWYETDFKDKPKSKQNDEPAQSQTKSSDTQSADTRTRTQTQTQTKGKQETA